MSLTIRVVYDLTLSGSWLLAGKGSSPAGVDIGLSSIFLSAKR